jgi:hypothetical protein
MKHTCHICKLDIGADAFCIAKVRGAREHGAYTELVPVHQACIERHEHREAIEAFMSSEEERRAARKANKTFREWYGVI